MNSWYFIYGTVPLIWAVSILLNDVRISILLLVCLKYFLGAWHSRFVSVVLKVFVIVLNLTIFQSYKISYLRCCYNSRNRV